MKSITNIIKIAVYFNGLALITGLPLAYIAHYVSFGLGLILMLIASFVAGVLLYATISKFVKGDIRVMVSLFSELLFSIGVWILFYNFLVLQGGKISPLITPSEAVNYQDHTFFHLKDFTYTPQNIGYYQSVRHGKDGSTTRTDYYVCPVEDSNHQSNQVMLYLGYTANSSRLNRRKFGEEMQNTYEYFARYDIEQSSFRRAVKRIAPKEMASKSIILYGIESPEAARNQAWYYLKLLFMIGNPVFWGLWATLYLLDQREVKKKAARRDEH